MDYWVARAAGNKPEYQPESPEGPRVRINKCHDQSELCYSH